MPTDSPVGSWPREYHPPLCRLSRSSREMPRASATRVLMLAVEPRRRAKRRVVVVGSMRDLGGILPLRGSPRWQARYRQVQIYELTMSFQSSPIQVTSPERLSCLPL